MKQASPLSSPEDFGEQKVTKSTTLGGVGCGQPQCSFRANYIEPVALHVVGDFAEVTNDCEKQQELFAAFTAIEITAL